jgi:hypothetical protein
MLYFINNKIILFLLSFYQMSSKKKREKSFGKNEETIPIWNRIG